MTMDLSFPDFSEALKAYFMGDKPVALKALTRLAAEHPDNAAVFIMLGNVHYSLGALDEALLNFRKAVELGPEYGHALYKMGVCSFAPGSWMRPERPFPGISPSPARATRTRIIGSD